jgi:hypothetical protein
MSRVSKKFEWFIITFEDPWLCLISNSKKSYFKPLKKLFQTPKKTLASILQVQKIDLIFLFCEFFLVLWIHKPHKWNLEKENNLLDLQKWNKVMN